MRAQIGLLASAVLMITNVLGSPVAAAGGYSNTAAPTNLEIVRNEGFMIFGPFGNPGTTPCAQPDRIWIAITHPQYKELLSAAMTAVAAGLKLRAYVHSCTMVPWYGYTVNELIIGGSLDLSR